MTAAASRDPSLYLSRFRGSETAVRAQLLALDEAAGARGLSQARRGDMQIVLAEVLNNVVEHAFDGKGGWIECRVEAADRRILVETRDDGRPLPPALLLDGPCPDSDGPADDLPEGGFGWFLVHSLTEDMTYERMSGMNVLSFSLLDD